MFFIRQKYDLVVVNCFYGCNNFSTDTPNFVTDIVRKDSVSANWMWWAFLITGLLTVFVYAKLYRKSDLKTDIEFYELRYGENQLNF